MQEKQKAIGKKVCRKSSNDVGKTVYKQELGKGRRKDVGQKFCKKKTKQGTMAQNLQEK